jgi:hypothetical protein
MDPEHWVDLLSAVHVAEGHLFSFSEDPEAALTGLNFQSEDITRGEGPLLQGVQDQRTPIFQGFDPLFGS